jgi:hypothetical protein
MLDDAPILLVRPRLGFLHLYSPGNSSKTTQLPWHSRIEVTYQLSCRTSIKKLASHQERQAVSCRRDTSSRFELSLTLFNQFPFDPEQFSAMNVAEHE